MSSCMLSEQKSCFSTGASCFRFALSHCCCCPPVPQACPTLGDPMGCSTPGFPVLYPSPRACSDSWLLGQWCQPIIPFSVIPFSSCSWVSDAIQSSRPLSSPSPPQSFLASGSFLMNQLSASGSQSFGALSHKHTISILFSGLPQCFAYSGCSLSVSERVDSIPTKEKKGRRNINLSQKPNLQKWWSYIFYAL